MTIELAKRLRHNATRPEQLMWRLLKPLRDKGWHFRRQAPIGPYIADFACLHAKLVIEVDGGTHDFTHEADAIRDDYMRSRGINVMRFTNDDVRRSPDGVLHVISGVLDAVSRTSNTPAPQGGGEPKPRRPRQPRTRKTSTDDAVRSPPPCGEGTGVGVLHEQNAGQTPMTDFDLTLTGTIVLPDRVVEAGHVAVRDGKVARVAEGPPPSARERHDFGRGLILPGAIDAQVHSLSQRGQEDFVWSTRAAAAGGVTTIIDMPYDEGNLVCSADAVRRKAGHAAPQARVDFALYGTIAPNDGAARIAEQAAAGVAAFKFSTFGTDPVRFPRIPPPLLAEAFAEVAKTGLTAGVHNEDDESVRAALAKVKAAGIADWRAHGLSRPPLTELLATLQIYETGAATGCPAHVVHCSLSRGYDIAADYRARGFAATIECCIHYLTLDEENDVRRLGGKAKINPPLRPRAEVEKLWQQVAAGNVTLVSTDHVSWSEDRKTDPDMLANASGVPGLEVMVPLFVKGALERGIPLTWAAKLMAENPARHFRLADKGALEVGKDADIAVLVPGPRVYDAAASGHNVVSWSPYNGLELPWTIAATWLRGRQVFDGTTVAEPGTGRWQKP